MKAGTPGEDDVMWSYCSTGKWLVFTKTKSTGRQGTIFMGCPFPHGLILKPCWLCFEHPFPSSFCKIPFSHPDDVTPLKADCASVSRGDNVPLSPLGILQAELCSLSPPVGTAEEEFCFPSSSYYPGYKDLLPCSFKRCWICPTIADYRKFGFFLHMQHLLLQI